MKGRYQNKTIGELCDFSNGHGFGPTTWAQSGLPIIRIQNLNGSAEFNYFSGNPHPDWLVEPGTLLFAWAGTRGASFGPTIWKGERGVLNQHIYRVHPKEGVDPRWLYNALRVVTVRIEKKAHGFKSTLLHVAKSDITDQLVATPPHEEQQKIADILGTWDQALEKLDALIAAKDRRKQALMQQFLTGRRRLPGSPAPVQFIKASELFSNRSERNAQDAPILSVTQDQGVVRRDSLDRKISHDEETNGTYKVVHAGDYIISLRSFQGGLEYSDLMGAVSPAYHVIYPTQPIDREFFRHYFKSSHFIGHLAVAVIGIRDGKQISFSDFGFIKLPYPHLEDQKRIGKILSAADAELRLLRQHHAALDQQKRGLMQQLLTGRTSVTP